jgi:hypothetical protein
MLVQIIETFDWQVLAFVAAPVFTWSQQDSKDPQAGIVRIWG